MISLFSEAEARVLYAVGETAHDFDHVLRVTRLAVQIATAEGADVEIVRAAALLHDLPPEPEVSAEAGPERSRRMKAVRPTHHVAAAERASRLLSERHAQPEQIAAVVHCIRAHRFRDRSIVPATLEARCLYDADKLDAMGAIGVLRAAAYAASHGQRLWHTTARDIAAQIRSGAPQPVGKEYTPVHEFVYKLRQLYGTLFTETGRALGRNRHATMLMFFTELDEELAPLRDPSSNGA